MHINWLTLTEAFPLKSDATQTSQKLLGWKSLTNLSSPEKTKGT